MARTKRKINPVIPPPFVEPAKVRIYRTGGYVRLSVEDSGKPGADTIEAQKAQILSYIEQQPDMTFCGVFCDNGHSGTNFERPAFEQKYQAKDEAFNKNFEYEPSVRNLNDNTMCEIMPFAKQCVCVDDAKVYAKHLENPTKVFSKWDYEKYMYGNSDDYICYTYNDDKDIYLVRQEVFEKTYALVEE